ncbi:hypothetical protein DPEC_G00294180, partial [Dallia pectoralis]
MQTTGRQKDIGCTMQALPPCEMYGGNTCSSEGSRSQVNATVNTMLNPILCCLVAAAPRQQGASQTQ